LNTLNQYEKDIYNCYLKNVRRGQPYNVRKDFSDMSPDIIVYLKKLSSFFYKFKHIKIDDFFAAPSIIHPDEKCPPLNFFITRPAIKLYSLSIQKMEDESPENQLDNIKESLRFIAMFCLKNKIQLEDYLYHKTSNMPTWMQHYREHHVNPYTMLELGDINKFKSMNEEERIIWSSDFFTKIDKFKTRYHNSEKTKTFLKEGVKKIKEFLKKELQISKI